MTESTSQLLPTRLIDAHVHLWDLQRLRLPWLGAPLDRSFLLSDYQQATAGLNVRRAVYVEVGVGADQRYEEADLIMDLCRAQDNPLAGIVMSGDVGDDALFDYLADPTVRRHVKGVRQGVPEDLQPSGAFVRGVQRLGELGVRFELNTDPARSLALVERCPQTGFILDHCGGATFEILDDPRRLGEWRRLMDGIGRHPNVACKLSGIVATAPADRWCDQDFARVFEHLLDTFGPDRLMFASDWPICSLSMPLIDWVRTAARVLRHRPEAERSAIFHDNAARWYDLEQGT